LFNTDDYPINTLKPKTPAWTTLKLGMPRRCHSHSTCYALFSVPLFVLSACAQTHQPTAADAFDDSQVQTKTIAEVLRADPRFSDFVTVIDLSGLAYELNAAKGVTVFAPTNAAFDRSDPGWRARTNLSSTSNGGAAYGTRQALMEQSGLMGIHPPSDFLGRAQDVRSIGGSVFHFDGLTPGVITITNGHSVATGIGFPSQAVKTASVQLPPIRAVNGLIYPVDAIIVR
jgi:uncharacterized surface protein with fasciclin (FAS1) repeats